MHKIGITAGDPAGIGYEVAVKAIENLNDKDIIPVLIGRSSVLERLFPESLSKFKIIDPGSGGYTYREGSGYFCDVKSNLPMPVPGKGSAETGKESLEYIDKAVELWKAGAIDAIVTGPVNKAFIKKSGVPFSGHTEYLADKIDESEPLMMMHSSLYRVLLATTHIPISRVRDSIDAEKLLKVIETGYRSIRSFDKGDLKIAIAGLDPHCGDDGAISNFDKEVTTAVVEKAKKSGINIEGPFAADTLFIPGNWRKYNFIVAQYHDQGLIPFKMLAFDTGVNLTLGLSLIRTSVDHGTAFDIAGKKVSSYKSMIEAIKLASQILKNRKK